MNTALRRGVVALATTLACLALQATPASASLLGLNITAGTMTLIASTGTGTVTDAIPFIPSTGTGCGDGMGVTATPTASVNAWAFTSFGYVGRFKVGTTWYVAHLARTGGTSGTVTSVTTTGATLNSAGLTLRLDIYVATNQSATSTDCSFGATRFCRFANVNVSLQGTYSGNINSPAVSDDFSLTGSGTLGTTSPPCSTPFTTYNAGTVTFTGLTANVVSVF